MLTNNNSYPLFIKGFSGFKIVQRERGYYYDKTLKHRIWLYTTNLRRNSFYSIRELIPIRGLLNTTSVCVLENVETDFRTNESDIRDYQKLLLKRTRFSAKYGILFYKRLAYVKNKFKKEIKNTEFFKFKLFDKRSNYSKMLTNQGLIVKVDKNLVCKFVSHRYLLRKAPYKFWNISSLFVNVANSLINRSNKLNFVDFLVLTKVSISMHELLIFFRKRPPWGVPALHWGSTLHKIKILRSLIILKIANKSKLDLLNKLIDLKNNLSIEPICNSFSIQNSSSQDFFRSLKSSKKDKLIWDKTAYGVASKNKRKKLIKKGELIRKRRIAKAKESLLKIRRNKAWKKWQQ